MPFILMQRLFFLGTNLTMILLSKLFNNTFIVEISSKITGFYPVKVTTAGSR